MMTVAQGIELLQKMPQHKPLAVDFDDDYQLIADIADFGDYIGFTIGGDDLTYYDKVRKPLAFVK